RSQRWWPKDFQEVHRGSVLGHLFVAPHYLSSQTGRSPTTMAATDFVGEIRSVGERLLLKLQQLPQAEPVELVAFSIIVLFTGNYCPGAGADSLQLLLCSLLLL
ncbi:RIKEN cDNA 2210020M01, isoform CRA_b, partial [Mus musculus]